MVSVFKLVVLAMALAFTAESGFADVTYYGVTTDKKIVQINLTSNAVTTIFNTPDVPYGLVIDSQGGFVYTQPFANEVRRYDPITGTDLLLAGSTQGIDGPRDIVLDPTGSSVFVSNFNAGTITRTDLSLLTTTTVISGFPSPQGLAFDSTGRLFVVAGGEGDCNSFAGNSSVFQIDPNTGMIVNTSTINFDPTNSLDGLVFDYFTGSLFTIPRCSAVLSAVDTNTLNPIVSITLSASFADGIASDGHGKLYIASRNDPGNGTNAQITSYDISTNTFTASTLVPGLAGLALSSDRPVAVPNVVGLTKAASTTSIAAVGLVVGAVTTTLSNSIPAGSVVSENPTAGTLVTPGSAVNLVISGSQPISVAPSLGSGGRQLFSFVARDQSGASSIQYSQFLFSKSGLSALNACYISYDPVANVFYLLSDDMTQWYGLLAGSTNTIGNAQCTIYGATSGSTLVGTDLTTNVDIGFRSGFSGLTNVYQFSGDTLGNGSGWQSMGTWNNTGDPSQVELVSLTPNFGAGTSQLFTAVTSDDDGGVCDSVRTIRHEQRPEWL